MNLIKRVLSVIGGVFVIAALVLIVGNVIIRSIFGVPIQGSYEMVALCAVLFVSVSIPMCTLAENHIEVEFLIAKLPLFPKMVLEIIARVLDCIFGLILMYAGYVLSLKMIKAGDSTDTLSIPEGPFRMIWVVCAALIAIISIALILRIPAKYRNVERMGENEPNGPESSKRGDHG